MGPKITLYDSNNTAPVGTHDFGNIKAQVPSNVLAINIWNNKDGQDAVSDLREPEIEVLDINGLTADTDVPRDKWVQVNVPAIDGDDTTFVAIGGDVTKKIRANNNVSTEYIIKGTPNTGDPVLNPENVCSVKFRLVAPINSTPGNKAFKIRIVGYYT